MISGIRVGDEFTHALYAKLVAIGRPVEPIAAERRNPFVKLQVGEMGIVLLPLYQPHVGEFVTIQIARKFRHAFRIGVVTIEHPAGQHAHAKVGVFERRHAAGEAARPFVFIVEPGVHAAPPRFLDTRANAVHPLRRHVGRL